MKKNLSFLLAIGCLIPAYINAGKYKNNPEEKKIKSCQILSIIVKCPYCHTPQNVDYKPRNIDFPDCKRCFKKFIVDTRFNNEPKIEQI